MSLGSTLSHVLGFIKGIHIPGVSINTTTLLGSVEQTLADRYGAAATKLATNLTSRVGMSGPDKLFAGVKAMFDDAMANGFKGDGDMLKTELVKVMQAAFSASLPDIESKATALAVSLTHSPLAGTVTSLVVQDMAQDVSAMIGRPAEQPQALAA